jgi:hypothetical protein
VAELGSNSFTALFIYGAHFGEHVVLAAVGSMSRAKSMYSVCARVQQKMRRRASRC